VFPVANISRPASSYFRLSSDHSCHASYVTKKNGSVPVVD
jgi:hypothetical protein